jgi:Ca2+-binding RTX toxin-like protein
MRNSVIIMLGVALMTMFALPAAAWDDVSHEEDVSWFPVVEWEDLLDVELEDQDCDDAWDDDEGGGELDAEYGDCYLAGTAPRQYLRCDYSGTSTLYTHHVVVGKTSGSDQVRMCASTDGGSSWSLKGYIDRDSYTMLKVYGNSASDNIKIQRTAYNYNANCNFAAWFTSAQIAYLYMYGQGNYDAVFGSDNGDSHLEGETVNAYGGNDHVLLTYYSGHTPYADGGTGNDSITGTAYADWIWGGDNNDSIDGLGGDDELGGGTGDDTIEGGTGDDWIEGGSGDDELFSGIGCDYLFGQSGYYDECTCDDLKGYYDNPGCEWHPSCSNDC